MGAERRFLNIFLAASPLSSVSIAPDKTAMLRRLNIACVSTGLRIVYIICREGLKCLRSRLGKILLLTEIHKHGTWTFFYTFKKFENTQSHVYSF